MEIAYAYRVTKVSANSILKLAKKWRSLFDLKESEPILPTSLVEKLADLFARAQEPKDVYEIGFAEDMHSLGEYDPVRDVMIIREDVWDKACMGEVEHSFTVAHEFGHSTLHHGPAFYRLEDHSYSQAQSLHADEHSEEQADLLACSLCLDPDHLKILLRQNVSLGLISRTYKIPAAKLERYIQRLREECGYDLEYMPGQMELKI